MKFELETVQHCTWHRTSLKMVLTQIDHLISRCWDLMCKWAFFRFGVLLIHSSHRFVQPLHTWECVCRVLVLAYEKKSTHSSSQERTNAHSQSLFHWRHSHIHSWNTASGDFWWHPFITIMSSIAPLVFHVSLLRSFTREYFIRTSDLVVFQSTSRLINSPFYRSFCWETL